jgi:hypothetical protein
MQADVMLIFDWRDGPCEGVLRERADAGCWYFKLLAERPSSSDLDDRLFGLWSIQNPDSKMLVDEFGDASPGTHVWPTVGGLGSQDARGIIESLLSAERNMPDRIIRTSDFVGLLEAWTVLG